MRRFCGRGKLVKSAPTSWQARTRERARGRTHCGYSTGVLSRSREGGKESGSWRVVAGGKPAGAARGANLAGVGRLPLWPPPAISPRPPVLLLPLLVLLLARPLARPCPASPRSSSTMVRLPRFLAAGRGLPQADDRALDAPSLARLAHRPLPRPFLPPTRHGRHSTGTGYTKMGFAGNSEPSFTFPTIIATREGPSAAGAGGSGRSPLPCSAHGSPCWTAADPFSRSRLSPRSSRRLQAVAPGEQARDRGPRLLHRRRGRRQLQVRPGPRPPAASSAYQLD